jgi:hypothetical protein
VKFVKQTHSLVAVIRLVGNSDNRCSTIYYMHIVVETSEVTQSRLKCLNDDQIITSGWGGGLCPVLELHRYSSG